ncbi:MAG: U32 family peptidase [Clostridia bacterium]|nr:U32 family peptidase [Clostridia bacterium]
MSNHLIPEVLAPAGDMERLDAALNFGADAVYLSGSKFGMRAASANFDRTALAVAVTKAHALGKKIYVTCNILPRNRDLDELPDYFSYLDSIRVDALIVSDFGVMDIAKKYAPHVALHISTQFGVVNHATATFLYNLGAKRVVLARELSMAEIREIRAKTPNELELEAFVHGAICMSYSGRCVISNYLTGRDANHGECAQPCRWKYSIVEETRPDLPMTLEEDTDGSYLFNANDMNMIEHVADLAQSGVASLKIEGRAKSAYYTAVTANAYRRAVDGYIASGFSADYKPERWIVEELNKISHRPYGTGFYYGSPSQYLLKGGYIRSYEVAAIVEEWANGWLKLSQRNRFFAGDTLDVLEPGGKPFDFTVEYMENDERLPISSAPHPMMTVWVPSKRSLKPGTLLRFNKENI